ncbi:MULTISPECIES: hypothetical protein [Pseudomonas]|uniref:Uncharacterized protein n=1 Tax=Pseudomonas mandelii TaxID=75612 RepID=A0ABY0VU37_9PSED|nr:MULTISPECIES: hypothetical protein [Pseudomonas]MBU0523127.1 hypothetical protein [Gammaproteobacteria bacterium]MBU0821520.1 hypothetical protein [Gammaproteobacteria bacterium]MBU0840809.1 hypothetical protein [Gammaproteobacteria bacterium]MBU1839614.1 hypothetical protein [Gammaproteobacteria bacterium]TWS01888.1 hypothetical protein FJD35_32910 [Pseudomonas mandelii]
MTDQPLFEGAHFQTILTKEPLKEATIFCQGSNSMLFERDNRLYRLTLEGCGHNFLAQQSAEGNRNVVEIIYDYGAVGPSDSSLPGSANEFYWLAEVERLVSVDETSETLLACILSGLLDDNDDLPANCELSEQCRALADEHPDLAGILITLAKSAEFAERHEGNVDAKIDNIMRRPTTGDLVWTDPLGGCLYEP